MGRTYSKRDPRCFDLSFGPHEPLRDRPLRYHERAGDPVGGEPAQGERELGLDQERRVTAGKDELQALVRKPSGVHLHLCWIPREDGPLGRQNAVETDEVRRVVASRRYQPGARRARDALSWPPVAAPRGIAGDGFGRAAATVA